MSNRKILASLRRLGCFRIRSWAIHAYCGREIPCSETVDARCFHRNAKTLREDPRNGHYPTPYQYALEAASPLMALRKWPGKTLWPILKRQALYSLVLYGEGMREPHWHPETAEMGYVAEGRARMSILSPSGKNRYL